MTPFELLGQVQKQFPVLVHGTGPEGQEALNELLREAIAEYQDRRGFRSELFIPDELANDKGVLLPAGWVTVLNSHDSQHVHVRTQVFDHVPEPEEGVAESSEPEKRIRCLANDYHIPPFSISYLQDLSGADLETVVMPPDAVSIIKRYLRALIDIPNTQRLRAMYEGIDHPAREQLPALSELEQKKTDIQEEMSLEAGDLLAALVL